MDTSGEGPVQSIDDLQLILRPAAGRVLHLGTSTCKRREKSDPDFPKPLFLSKTRVAYRVADLRRYQEVLAAREPYRPTVADDALAASLKSVAARRAKAARKAEADAASAASRGNGAQRKAVVPAPVPAAAQSDSINPSRGGGKHDAEARRRERKVQGSRRH